MRGWASCRALRPRYLPLLVPLAKETVEEVGEDDLAEAVVGSKDC